MSYVIINSTCYSLHNMLLYIYTSAAKTVLMIHMLISTSTCFKSFHNRFIVGIPGHLFAKNLEFICQDLEVILMLFPLLTCCIKMMVKICCRVQTEC